MSQRLRRRLTTSLAVLATALSSAIGVGAVTASPASAASSTVWQGPSAYTYENLYRYSYNSCYYGCYTETYGYDEVTQLFTAADSGPASKVVLSTPYASSAEGTVEIRSAENSPSDGGTLVAHTSSSSLQGSDFGVTTTFRMSGETLTAGTTYELVFRNGSNNGGYNYSFGLGSSTGSTASWHYSDIENGYDYDDFWDNSGYSLAATVYESDGADSPTVTYTVSPASPDGANGWYKTHPTVHFTCDDDLEVTDCPADISVADGTHDATTGAVHDNNGNTTPYTIPAMKVDTTPPSVSIGVDNTAAATAGTYNASTNWYLSTPDFTGGCEDGATCTVEYDSPPPYGGSYCSWYGGWYCGGPITGGYGHWTRTATDAAGNVATAQTSDASFNPATPTISVNTVSGLNGAGWSRGTTHYGYDWNYGWRDIPDTYITWNCSGQYAGISTCGGQYNQTAVTDETPVTGTDFVGTVTDVSGKTATATVNVKVDKTPPTIAPVITGTVGSNGWYTSPVTVSWSCADALSGLKSCSQQTDTFTDAEGTSSGAAADVADNTNGGSVTIKSDTTPPVITGSVVTDKGYGGVYDDPITVHWTCSESGSGNGVSGIDTCPSDTTVTGIGTDTVASATVLDNAGNATVGTVSHLFRRVDAPAITVTGADNGHTYAFGSTVTPACTAISGSGDTLTCTGSTEGGTTDGSGLFVYTATAVDPITHLSSVKTVEWIVAERAAVSLVIGDVTDGSSYAYGTAVHPSCTAVDASGHAVTCTGHVTGGDSDGSGLFTFRASATDSVTGEVSSGRVSWTVAVRPAPSIAIGGVVAGSVYPYGSTVTPTCQAADAKGNSVSCDGTTSSHKLLAGGVGWLYKVTSSDPVTGALSTASASWTIAAQGTLAISGLPTRMKSGKPVLVAGKAYAISVSFAGSTSSKAELAPYWLKPVRTNAAGTSGKPTAITGTFAPGAGGSYVWTFTPTKAMSGTYRKFGVATADGTMTYQTVYIK